MEFLEIYSSIVLVGENFPPHLFKVTEFSNLLGEPDPQQQIILPVLSQHIFQTTGYKVVITPNRIDLGYHKQDFLPEYLKTIADSIIEKLQQIDMYKCYGVGMNVDVVISETRLGISGVDYCRKNFLSIKDLEDKLDTSSPIANTVKLLYTIEGIKYTVNIEPDFRSNGENLQIKINAHQHLEPSFDLKKSMDNYLKIKTYLTHFHDRFLGE